MSRYLPVVWFVLAAVAVLLLAGLGAAGSWRGARRYVRDWGRVMIGTLVVAAVLFLIFSQFMPSP
jgi:hypothetical protein